MKSQLKRPSYMLIGTVLTVAIGYPLGAFLPMMRSIAKTRQEIHEKQNFVAQVEKMKPLVAQQKASLAATTDYIQKQRQALIPPGRLSTVFSAISQLAKQSGAMTTRFEPRSAIAYDSFQKVPLHFGVSGPTPAVERLLVKLEELPYRIWIENLKLEAPAENGENTKCTLDLALFVDNSETSD